MTGRSKVEEQDRRAMGSPASDADTAAPPAEDPGRPADRSER